MIGKVHGLTWYLCKDILLYLSLIDYNNCINIYIYIYIYIYVCIYINVMYTIFLKYFSLQILVGKNVISVVSSNYNYWWKHNNNGNNTTRNWIVLLNIINLKRKITQYYLEGDSSSWLVKLCNWYRPSLTCLPQDTTAQQVLYG